jgi:uncharacterized SAM-binding protein YcdF (DUF218 family)
MVSRSSTTGAALHKGRRVLRLLLVAALICIVGWFLWLYGQIRALALYRQGLAPLVITLGGDGGEEHSEGGVGHDYLLAHGVPEDQIIAETQSTNTEESAARLAAIARENHLNRVLAVSDGTHLFRIHALSASLGLNVFTSPRAETRPLGHWDAVMRLMHEMFSYTLWRLKVH